MREFLMVALALAGAATCTAASPPTERKPDVVLVTSEDVPCAAAQAVAHELRNHGLVVAYQSLLEYGGLGYDDLGVEALGYAPLQAEHLVHLRPMLRVAEQRQLLHHPLPFMGYMKGYYGRKLVAGNFSCRVVPAHQVPIDHPAVPGFAGSLDRSS